MLSRIRCKINYYLQKQFAGIYFIPEFILTHKHYLHNLNSVQLKNHLLQSQCSLEADEQERDSRRVKVVGRLTAIHVKCTETLPQRTFFNSRSQPGKHLLINTCYPIQSGGSSISTSFTYRSFTQFDCYS